jgi:hypothetical protein
LCCCRSRGFCDNNGHFCRAGTMRTSHLGQQSYICRTFDLIRGGGYFNYSPSFTPSLPPVPLGHCRRLVYNTLFSAPCHPSIPASRTGNYISLSLRPYDVVQGLLHCTVLADAPAIYGSGERTPSTPFQQRTRDGDISIGDPCKRRSMLFSRTRVRDAHYCAEFPGWLVVRQQYGIRLCRFQL